MKKVAVVLIMLGVSLLVYSLYQISESNLSQQKALVKAEELIATEEHPIFKKGQEIGVLEIPKLDRKLPIIEGTDKEELAKGVGHYIGSALPNQQNQIVLSGHRDTVFTGFDELENGDLFTVKMGYGTFTYKIVGTKIVDAEDRTVIRSTFPNEELIVTTCYPFEYIGNAPKRYIITAKRANSP
ncbi:class D sortase [Fredinandcohnia humi]